MKVLIAKGVTQAVGETLDLSWREFCVMVHEQNRTISDESSESKREGRWFSACEYAGNHRRRENLNGRCWAVVADLDGVHDTAGVEKALARWEYIAWTTWSSTPAVPRWRVVIPIEGGCEPAAFAKLAGRVLREVEGLAKIDQRSYTAEQLWFFPEHKRSMAREHVIWMNVGSPIRGGHLIEVDFTGVKLVTRPGEIERGGRNEALVRRLAMADALRCEDRAELRELALGWNSRLKEPMSAKEVNEVVRKTWNWMQRGAGVQRRAEAWRRVSDDIELPKIGTSLMSSAIRDALMPESIVGDFLYPGATMISAKMKEGKSFLAMQLALSVATGTPFLGGDKHDGFLVRAKKKVVVMTLEDTAGGIQHRFYGNLAAGHLATPAGDDVVLVFAEDLEKLRAEMPDKMPGVAIFENLVQRWYNQGYRVIAIDPLRVFEATLGVSDYPGTFGGMNVHARDFQTMRYFTSLAQQYDDLSFLISMHHGKNKSGHEATDPGDMIAGTTGFGAGAITTISLLPIPATLEAGDEDAEGYTSKRRELYIHGRYTRECRMLIEQDKGTGVWKAIGKVADEMMSNDREQYFRAMIELGGADRWLLAKEIAKAVGTKEVSVHKMLKRALMKGSTYNGWRLQIKRGPGGGYRLIAAGGGKSRWLLGDGAK